MHRDAYSHGSTILCLKFDFWSVYSLTVIHLSLLLAPDRDHVSALARLNSHLSPCPSSACLSDSVSRVDTHPRHDGPTQTTGLSNTR